MSASERSFTQVWGQKALPVIFLGAPDYPLLVKLPYAEGNRDWLQDDRRSHPKWISTEKAWSIPKSWFDDTVRRCLERYRSVYVIQAIRETEKCAPACVNAVGVECTCSCLGANHGSGISLHTWFVVSDAFAVRHGPVRYAVRLLRPYASAAAGPRNGRTPMVR